MSQTTPSPADGKKIVFLASCSTICMVMGLSSITPMVPLLARQFSVSLTSASLVITLFTLPGILFAILAGMLADRYGRRKVLAASLLLFAFGGVGCIFAQGFTSLLVLRFIQGIGAAPLGALNTTILADAWTGRELSQRIGINMTILSISGAIYPFIGGFLASFDWRYPFLLPLIAFPVALLALKTPLAGPANASSFHDYLSGMNRTFHNSRILGLLCMTFLTFLMLYGPLITCFPMLADQRFHAGPGTIGSLILFSSLGAALGASRLGSLSLHVTPRRLLFVSQGLYIFSLILMPQLSTLAWFALPIFLYGLGQGLNVPTVQSQLVQEAPAHQRAAVMAANSTLLRLGQTLAPLIFSGILVHVSAPWAFYSGILLALLLIVMAAIFFGPGKKKGPV